MTSNCARAFTEQRTRLIQIYCRIFTLQLYKRRHRQAWCRWIKMNVCDIYWQFSSLHHGTDVSNLHIDNEFCANFQNMLFIMTSLGQRRTCVDVT